VRHDEFIASVSELGGPADRDESAELTRIVLEDLGQRLKGAEPANLAEQLPEQLKPSLTAHAGAAPVTDDVDDFLRRAASHLGKGISPEQARIQVRAVFATLARAVSEGEINDIRSQLPAGFGPLFE
jgi:uncharacterized protein (DUF2267 family)